MRIYCTECGEKAVIRTSEQISKTTRKLSCSCTDIQCGHTFVVDVVFSHTVSPSAYAMPEKVREAIQNQSPSQIRALFLPLA